MEKLKAIFHVNETANWKKTLVNVTNFIADVGEGGAEIEVLANGAAVLYYFNVITHDISETNTGYI